MKNQTDYRIALLRLFMKENGLQGFIVPSTDGHISEYIPEHWASRKWISGFSGSAGTVVVTRDKAGLWTDSRYFLQAENEISGSEIKLFKDRLPETISITDWLKSELSANDQVGIDGNVYPAKEALKLKADLESEKITLVSDFDPFETIWNDRPALPQKSVSIFPVEIAGESVSQKIKRVLAEAEKLNANTLWISSLDTVAWLFNIRGSDVAYNPVVVAHAFISPNKTLFFVDRDKISPTLEAMLQKEGVQVVDYRQHINFLNDICNESVCLDSSKISYSIYLKLKSRNRVIDTPSIADCLKSMKNEVESEGFRRTMISDGVALTRFFRWLEQNIQKGTVTEYIVSQKLKEYRSQQNHFIGESFPAIVGYMANGSIVHYCPSEANSLKIKPEGLLLIDSGGQYLEGTTDITRTIAVGEVSDEMKKDFTFVLKGMIALSKAVFPAGTRGSQIDVLARQAMWASGINYGHGTGHGVGHYLNVHEGPQSIRQEENPATLKIGMVITNEPGIYRDRQYGIRTENMLLIQKALTTSYGDFYHFETLTLCYIDTTLILKELMTIEEITWLTNYHRMVYEKLAPHLSDEENDWLKNKSNNGILPL